MKAIRLKIIDLMDKHESFYRCKGCSICTEIQQLGKLLERDPAEKRKNILAKGKDMTKSDVAFLLEMEVNKRDISKALKMNQTEFSTLMKNWGFARTVKNEEVEKVAKIQFTVEEYNKFKHQGYKDKEIAEIKGMKPTALANWKWINGIKAPSKRSDKPAVNVKPTPKTETPIYDKTSEMRQLIDDLSDSNNEKTKTIQELQEQVKELESLNAACSDVENECSSLREDLDRERKAKEWAQQEYIRVQKDLENKDYSLENLLNKQAETYSSLIQLEKEIRALKKLLAIYIAVK